MSNVRIWTLESDFGAKIVKSLVDKLETPLEYGPLSIRVSGKRALPKRDREGKPLENALWTATQHCLKRGDRIIFVINKDRRTTIRRPQRKSRLFKQVEQFVNDHRFSGKVFLAPSIQGLETSLRRVLPTVAEANQARLMDYAESQLRQLCISRNLDWDTMTEADRENFVDALIHEDRECLR